MIERREVRSAWKDRTKVENDSEIDPSSTKQPCERAQHRRDWSDRTSYSYIDRYQDSIAH